LNPFKIASISVSIFPAAPTAENLGEARSDPPPDHVPTLFQRPNRPISVPVLSVLPVHKGSPFFIGSAGS